MLKIAVTGPNGLVGSRIIELLNNDFHFLSLTHESLDITNRNQTLDVLKNIDFDILLHLAGYTNVEGSEIEKELAHSLNVAGTKNVFEAVQQKGKKMIYISTDFVFDGKNPPFFEDSTPNPLGYYGMTKYEGEKIVKDKAMIVRISYPYGNPNSKKPDFVTKIAQMLKEGKELSMMTDAAITPTFIDDIAQGLKYLFEHYTPEIYHLVGSQSLSPYEAGQAIAKSLNLPTTLIKPTTFEEYSKGRAPRPQYSEVKSKRNNFMQMKGFEQSMVILPTST